MSAVIGQTYRVELRYRIADLTADTTGSRGLSAAKIAFTQTGGGSASGLRRSNLSNQQAGASSPILNPDSSVLLTDIDATTGLIGEFRGGLTSDNAQANGTPDSSGWTILPLSLSAPAASTSWGSGNPTVANTDFNANRFGLYAFEFVYGGGNVTFNAAVVADPPSGNHFGYFTRTGATNSPVPANSNLSSIANISFVAAGGACCDASGACSVLPLSQCTGVFVAEGSVCSGGTVCPVTVGACCTLGGACVATTPAVCTSTFQQNTACSPTLCVPGACCAVTGACTVSVGFDCTAAGSSFGGAGTACSPNPCPQPGACCLSSGCSLLLGTACASQGGMFMPQVSTCAPSPCPQSCCLSNFSCLIGLPADCTLAGGTPTGQSTCLPLLCCPTPLVTGTSANTPFSAPMPVSLSVQATFPGTLSYQWRKGGTPIASGGRISGANSQTLSFSSTLPTDAGTYDCVVTGSCGRSATSGTIDLQLCSLPTVTPVQPSVSAQAGATTALQVTSSGLGTFSYQWRKAGVALTNGGRFSGVDTAQLQIVAVEPLDRGSYECVVTSAPCGVTIGTPIVLNIVCSSLATDCNSNAQCDVLELVGLDDVTAPSPASDSFFGWAVAADAGRVIVGERFASVDLNAGAGRAYIYTLNGQAATFEAALQASDPQMGADFGHSVGIDGQWAVIGADSASSAGLSQAGAVYVFRLVSGVWTFFQRLSEPTPVAMAQYGIRVAIDQDRIVVGAFRGNGTTPVAGAAYVYRFNGINWALEAPLTASDGQGGDGFGLSVAIDDPYIIVSAPYDTDGNTTSGSAYIFFRGFSGWTQQSKIRPRGGQPGTPIGEALAISGDIAVLSSVLEDVNGIPDAGAAYVFRRTDTRWTQQRRLTAASPVASGRFGFGISIEGNTMAVGEFTRMVQGLTWAGSLDVFVRRGNFWSRATQINSPRPEAFGRFGYGVAIESGRLVAGAFSGSVGGLSQAGWARVFSLAALDCNSNQKPDICEIAQGVAIDANGNGIPDACETSVCPPDFNDTGFVSVQDLFDFLIDWFENNLTADFNDSGLISVQDLFDYLTAFFAGCS